MSTRAIAPLIIAASLVLLPNVTPVSAQCVFNDSHIYTAGGVAQVVRLDYFSMNTCSIVSQGGSIANAFVGSFPNAHGYALRAAAYLPATGTNNFINWNCDCGSVTISNANGLPVELMSFGVE